MTCTSGMSLAVLPGGKTAEGLVQDLPRERDGA
jgi:hypothetical protein